MRVYYPRGYTWRGSNPTSEYLGLCFAFGRLVYVVYTHICTSVLWRSHLYIHIQRQAVHIEWLPLPFPTASWSSLVHLTGWPASPWSTLSQHPQGLWLQLNVMFLSFFVYVGTRILNPGPHACSASTLPSESYPQGWRSAQPSDLSVPNLPYL